MASEQRGDGISTPGTSWRGAVELAASIITPISLITAALYYFGWVRSDAIARTFGYDVDLLGLTTQDYLLRSVEPMYVPIIGVFVVATALSFVGRWVNGPIARSLVSARRAVRATRLLYVVGGLAIVAGFIAVPNERSNRLYMVGALLVVGALLIAFGLLIQQVVAGRSQPSPQGGPPVAAMVALIVIGLVGLFAGITRYADQVGLGRAQATINNIERLGDVILYSDHDLRIAGGGTRCMMLPGDDGSLRYRYDGLKLFTQTNDRLLLLPAGYGRDGVAEIIILSDGDNLRMDISRAALHGRMPPPAPVGAERCA